MDPLEEKAIFNERHVRVICVGAGPSGICMAYKLQRDFRRFDLKIFEKNPDIGGTWYENRYPGCACDVPAHNYTFSFEPKADFTSVYSGSAQIRSYLNSFAAKYNLRRFIHPSHAVTRTEWDSSTAEWIVQVRRRNPTSGQAEVFEERCDLLIHATGYLNKPSWPHVPGLDTFQGKKLHSAAYEEGYDLSGKKVLLVGGGSSAVQILPAIQPIAEHIKTFIRSPAWLLPQIQTRNGTYSHDEIEEFKQNPELVTKIRQENERAMNSIFTIYMKGTVMQEQAKQLLSSEARRIIGDEEIAKKLIPDFAVGCKRIIPTGSNYLKSLQESNVSTVYTGVSSFTPTGCIDDEGNAHEGDVVICATGFDMSFIPRYPILADGKNLQTEWSESLTGYMGVGISGFPNTFTMLGPYSPVSNGPTVASMEAQADYICAFIDRWQTEPAIRTISLKPEAAADFTSHVTDIMKTMVWTDGCRNSHNNHIPHSRTPTTWPGSSLHFLEAMRDVRYDDWQFSHHQGHNRFSCLGNGISQTEWDPTADPAYYIRTEDTGKHGSRRKRNLLFAKSGSLPPRALHRQAKLGPKASLDGSHEKKENAAATAAAEPHAVQVKVEAAATVVAVVPEDVVVPSSEPARPVSTTTNSTASLPKDTSKRASYYEPRASKLSSKIRKHWSMIVRQVS